MRSFPPFLDDVYFTSPTPNRTRTAYDSLGEKLQAHAGIELHTGKTRVWNRASVCPEGMVELGPEVWNPEGVKVLGTLVGSTRFVEEVVNKRLEEEAKLWEAIPTVPDLQAAWQIFMQCAPPHVADSPAIPVRRVCAGARCRDVASDGHIVGTLRRPTRG